MKQLKNSPWEDPDDVRGMVGIIWGIIFTGVATLIFGSILFLFWGCAPACPSGSWRSGDSCFMSVRIEKMTVEKTVALNQEESAK